MVTFDNSYADDYGAVKDLLESGMSIARINCSHDDASTWLKMIEHVKMASVGTGLRCKVYMDLAGPKIRTFLPRKGAKKAKLRVDEGDTSTFLKSEIQAEIVWI